MIYLINIAKYFKICTFYRKRLKFLGRHLWQCHWHQWQIPEEYGRPLVSEITVLRVKSNVLRVKSSVLRVKSSVLRVKQLALRLKPNVYA